MNNYSYSKQLNLTFGATLVKIAEALKEEGFGILTDIDVKKTLKEKLGIDFKQYHILGVCNPSRAFKALQAEEEIGLLMPCNIIVYETDDGVVVSVLKPKTAFKMINNPELEPMATEVEDIFKKVIDQL